MDMYAWLRRSLSRTRKSDTLSESAIDRPVEPTKALKDDEELFGITDRLIDFVKSFTLDTFKNFPLQDEQEANCHESSTTSENVHKDLSDWQERHARLVLSKIKEMSELRFRLCPRHLKELQFWRIYFSLVKSYVAEYELHAIRMEKLKQLKDENEIALHANAYEVEMSEVISTTKVAAPSSLDHNAGSLCNSNE